MALDRETVVYLKWFLITMAFTVVLLAAWFTVIFTFH